MKRRIGGLAVLPLLLSPLEAQEAPGTTEPILVHVVAEKAGDSAAREWVKELRAAIEGRKDELRLTDTKDKAELVVRVDDVQEGEGERHVMRGVLLRGERTQPFSLIYPGSPRPQAEALARNLRRYAEQLRTGAPTAP